MVVAVGTVVGLRINGTTSVNVFFYMGTIGVLSLLVAYIVTNLGAAKFLVLDRRENPLQLTIIGIAIAALVYVEYKNIKGTAYPYDRFPYVVLAWLVLGALITVAFPKLVRRMAALPGMNAARAVTMASTAPARVLGERGLGRIRTGGCADLVLLDVDLGVRLTMVAGVVRYRR